MHPRKVKVRSRNKPSKERDFARLYLAQEIFLAPSDRTAVSPATPAASPRLDEDVESFGHQSTTAKSDGGDTGNEGKVEGGMANKRRATWAMRFSLDGQYLAVAGQDAVIRVYAVLSTPDARQRALFETYESAGCMPISAHNRSATDSTAVNSSLECERKDGKTNSASGGDLPHLLVFSQKPVREFRGHTSDILDLSWSKGGFLLSAGMDKTARVWHMSKPSSLVAFKHGDFVTSVVFHPRDDRFFLSGSLDGKLRLWNISTKRVQASQEIPGLITACAFTHSGKTACVGTFSGAALFYHTEDLVFLSSVAVRSPTGKYQKGGRKITAIEPILPDIVTVDEDSISKTGRDAKKAERERVLITSNDSRVRAYDLANNTIVARFKARSYNNRSSQIKATMSDDNVYVVAGSEATSGNEGGQVHIWECSSILFEGSTRSMLAKLASTGMSAMTSANQRTTGLLRSAAKAGGGAAVPNEKELEKVMQKSKNRSATTADSVVEYFTAHAGTVTCAIMAPLRTNTLLRQANDPILVRTEEKLKHSRLAGSGNLAEMLAGVPINIGRGLAYAIQTPLRAVNHATRHGSGGTDTPPKDSTSISAENNEMNILNRKLNRIILTVDDNAIVRVWRSDSLQTV
jgi:WD40 repeat protein